MALLFSLLATGLSARQKMPLAFYLKNLPMEIIGEFSDSKIKSILENDGFIVIEVDCSGFPKTSPELAEVLLDFHLKSPDVYSKYETSEVEVDPNQIFYVPEGYVITRNIPIWSIKEHGADGSLERVVATYNSDVVKKHCVKPISDPSELRNKDGSEID